MLAALVFIEGAALAAGTIYLVVEIFTADSKSIGTAIAYALTVAVFAALVVIVGRFTLIGRPWIRGAVLCIAVLQLLLAYSIIITKAPTLGWILVVPSVLLVVLLFTPSVLRATARPARED
jgi:hypothetical protein